MSLMGLRAGTEAAGRALRTGARRTARAARSASRGVRGVGGLARRVAHAQGAGQSGLGRLIEISALNSAGDAMLTVALAGTLFFGLDVEQARGQVALYLLVSMAPFALVAPLIGPVLDRMSHARRFAMAGTFGARGLLCWGMAGAVLHGDEITFLPAAFGVLVLSKAFGVLRAAVTPRVLPDQITLVTANARSAFAGLIAASVTVPVAAALGTLIGADWLLRLATVTFLAGALFSMGLPRHADVPEPEPEPEAEAEAEPEAKPGLESGGDSGEAHEGGRRRRRPRPLLRVGPVVAEAMLANAALRAFSGFLILYLAFLLREESFEPVSGNVALGLLAAAAGAGGMAGTSLGAWMKARAPRAIVRSTLAFVTAAAAVAAALFGLWAALGVAAAAGLGQSLGKLSMDAVVQREIGEDVRSSTFAVSETLHQLVWVLGGLFGLGLSIVADGRPAMSIVAAALAAALALLVLQDRRRKATLRARHREYREQGERGEPRRKRPARRADPHPAEAHHGEPHPGPAP
ncbi:MFS transporter [Actinomadura sp. NBRC 104412]|uniref:MFS transporter n=1 Tax=Actinomadura sp. NBRC 104412 TaxID=3032203 RepID=UPI0024A2FBF3|nr:MFS transporter [Actinomadura sp. NBRC 104412]GLZ05914.1 MFS transporter [Actinomadura sp. NBRC 104412]